MFKIALKDLKLFLADRKATLLVFALPICITTLFAFAIGGVGQSKDEDEATQLVIADEDQTITSKQIIAQLDSLKEYEVYRTTTDSAENFVKKGDVAAILEFHKGFEQAHQSGNGVLPLEFKYDAAREAEVGILRGSLTAVLFKLIGSRNLAGNVIAQFDQENAMMPEEVRKQIHEKIKSNFSQNEIENSNENLMKVTALMAEKQNSPGLIHAVAGTSVMMLLFSVVGMGASLLEEKEQGTFRRLLHSPVNSSSILFGKMLTVNLISITQLSVMFLFARFAFGLDIFSHIPSLLLMIIASAFACSGFGVCLASFAKTRSQIQGLSTLIVLVMSCIGGSMIPTFTMPAFMRSLSVFSVNYWSIQGFYDIFWRMLAFDNTTFLSRVMALFLIGIFLNTVAHIMFKRNLLKMI